MQSQNEIQTAFFNRLTAEAGITVTRAQSALFQQYMKELLDWNRSVNITRIVEPNAVTVKHFLDSILTIKHVAFKHKRVADVGSGGGFPGIPLAIIEQTCSLVLIESIRKKANFLKHLVRTLRLDNVRVFNGRAEAYPGREAFDIVISRAFSSVTAFSRIAAPLAAPNGSIVCMKGKLPQDEINAVTAAIGDGFVLETHTYALPEQHGERSLVVLEKCFT